MSLNGLDSNFLEKVEDSLGFSLPEKYKVILGEFGDVDFQFAQKMDEMLSIYELSLDKVNNVIQKSGYVIKREAREGTYYMDYVRPKVSKVSDVKIQITQLLDIAISSGHSAFNQIDFDTLTIGGEKFKEIEFVKKVQEIVAMLLQSDDTVLPSTKDVQTEEPQTKDVQTEGTLVIPENLDSIRSTVEKLSRLYKANQGVVISKADISSITGILGDRISNAHWNLRKNFPLSEGMLIGVIKREAYVYCREPEFEGIKTEYIQGANTNGVSESSDEEQDVQAQENDKEGLEEKDEGTQNEDGEIVVVESYLHLFKSETDPYKLYEYYLQALGQERRIKQANDAGLQLANATVTIKSINSRLEANNTGQVIVSVEGKRGMYKLVGGAVASKDDGEQNISGTLVGENFCISEERIQGVVDSNKKIFNRDKLSVKGQQLSIDEFIFCVLCWENQDIGVDQSGICRNFIEGVSMSWEDIIRLKSSIGLKFGDMRLEFLLLEGGSILLKEKNQAEFGRKFLDFMESRKGEIVRRHEIQGVLIGIGALENFKVAYSQANQLISGDKESTIHKLGGRNDWEEFYYGDSDDLQRLKCERVGKNRSNGRQPENNTEREKSIKIILSEAEISSIQGMDLSFEIDLHNGTIDGITLGVKGFNVFLLCVLQKGHSVHLGNIFKKFTDRDALEADINKMREIYEEINEAFLSTKPELLLGNESGSDYIWFGELQGESDEETESPVNGGDGRGTKGETEESTTKMISKGDIAFTWDTELGLVEYEGGSFALGDLNNDLSGYIERLFRSSKDKINLIVKGKNTNPKFKARDINRDCRSRNLPFGCGKINGKNMTFGVLNSY